MTVDSETSSEVVADQSKDIEKLGFEQYLAVVLWLGWFSVLPFIYYLAFYLYGKSMVGFSLVVGLLILASAYPVDPKLQPKWGYAIGDWIIRCASEYLGMKVIIENKKELEKSAPAIFVLEPHDVLPVAFAFFHDSLGFFKGHKLRGCVSSACFNVPFMRHIYTWTRATSVDKKNLQYLIERGSSPIVCPGGAQECVFLEKPDEIVLFLNNRFGLIKLAFQYGVPLIPSFSFGQRPTYDFWVPQSKFLQNIGRKMGYIPLVFFGALGLPMFIPKSKQITTVVGAPIPVPKVADPTDEQIKEYHGKLVTAFKEIFEKYKGESGTKNMSLRII